MLNYRIPTNEFGMDFSHQVWCPFIWKQYFPDSKIRVTGSHYFPEEITKQFCEEYVVEQNINDNGPFLHYHYLLRKIRKVVPIDFLKRKIYLPPNKRIVDEPYICFIPHLTERWFGKTIGSYHAGGVSVPFKNWMEYKRIVNEKGYKVFVLGNTHDVGYEGLPYKDLGDYHFYREGENNNTHYLWKQIQIMQHAKFTIGTGGGGLVAPTVGLPCISVDVLFKKHFTKKFPFNSFEDFNVLCDYENRNSEDMIRKTNEFILSSIHARLV
jgi:hypothetical protein